MMFLNVISLYNIWTVIPLVSLRIFSGLLLFVLDFLMMSQAFSLVFLLLVGYIFVFVHFLTFLSDGLHSYGMSKHLSIFVLFQLGKRSTFYGLHLVVAVFLFNPSDPELVANVLRACLNFPCFKLLIKTYFDCLTSFDTDMKLI